MAEFNFLYGFSSLDLQEKIRLIAQYTQNPFEFINDLKSHSHPDDSIHRRYMNFSENSLTNFFLPYSIAPNFLINGSLYHVPMVSEESSVVAAASAAANFWSKHGGFRSVVRNMIKKGQVHFLWKGDANDLKKFIRLEEDNLISSTARLTSRMSKRGGGIIGMDLLALPEILPDYYQLDVRFKTDDAMGANIINSCLERLAAELKSRIEANEKFSKSEKSCEILMSILSNYSPECLVSCSVETEIRYFKMMAEGFTDRQFAERFLKAVRIGQIDLQRAVTQNKGIFNGIDAVCIATGNDFRAVEANGHAYATRDGTYRGLSNAEIINDRLIFSLELPMMVGTVGGVTNQHPLAHRSLEILGHPGAGELMQIIAAVGLANNFSAIRSLISGGIQAGHMKLHLSNILNQIGVTDEERKQVEMEFEQKSISFSGVMEYITNLRNPV